MRGDRIPLWDNARFACIVLVVMGHAIQRQALDSDNALTLYLFVYAFHMPAFAIISGYFSKASPPGTRQMRRVLSDFVLPYVIFETIWSLVQFLVEGRPVFNPTEPSWTLWFLLALAIFRLVLPYLVLVRWPVAWAIALSVGVGYLANVDSTFSLSRAIGILPFFVLGWQLRQWNVVDRWRDLGAAVWGWRAVALGLFGVWLAVVALNIQLFRAFDLRFWFFYDDSYQALGEPVWWAGLLRLGLIALAVVLSAAFFVLVPRRETFFSAFGQATMYVYLLHSFVLYPLRESGVLRDDHASATWLLTMVFASTAIAIVLSSPVVRRLFRPFVEPKPRWLLRETDDLHGESREDAVGARRDP
ncbi:acyltransferase family protein [Pseudolysinimonas sp.]|uniref:acyltransferase family protein n=1 Tax=Pseudolysinimonas sp. TaxID=2680009 RepID=UPI0037851503